MLHNTKVSFESNFFGRPNSPTTAGSNTQLSFRPKSSRRRREDLVEKSQTNQYLCMHQFKKSFSYKFKKFSDLIPHLVSKYATILLSFMKYFLATLIISSGVTFLKISLCLRIYFQSLATTSKNASIDASP